MILIIGDLIADLIEHLLELKFYIFLLLSIDPDILNVITISKAIAKATLTSVGLKL